MIIESPLAATVGGVSVPGTTIGNVGNPNLKPERSREYEVGFDLGVLDERNPTSSPIGLDDDLDLDDSSHVAGESILLEGEEEGPDPGALPPVAQEVDVDFGVATHPGQSQ